MSIKDIQILINFANFYQYFILDFDRIIIPFILILKRTESSKPLAPKAFKTNDNEVIRDNSSKANETVKNLSKFKKPKK